MSVILCSLKKCLKKGGDTKMKARIVISVVAALTLVASFVPSLVYAATDTGVVPGSFTLGNVAPTIVSIALYDVANSPAATMDPQSEYYLRLQINDPNSMADLTMIQVYLYYDADGSYSYGTMPSAGQSDNCAVFTWYESGLFTMDAGTSTTWSLVTANCSAPSMLATTGYFDFHFVPGKAALANEGAKGDQWHVYAIVHDATNSGTLYLTGKTMNWYGEIASISPSIHWSNVSLNSSNAIADNTVSAIVIANGNYSGQIKSTSPWSINGSTNTSLNTMGTPGFNEFSLKADGMGNLSTATQVSTAYLTFFNIGIPTVETGATYSGNTLWLSLGSSGILPGTYTGVITYKNIPR